MATFTIPVSIDIDDPYYNDCSDQQQYHCYIDTYPKKNGKGKEKERNWQEQVRHKFSASKGETLSEAQRTQNKKRNWNE